MPRCARGHRAKEARVLSEIRVGKHARLLDLREVPREPSQTVLALVVRTSHHWAVHTGQIVYATRLITQAGLDELWMKTMI